MKTLNIKKSKYEQVAEILEQKGHILDDEAFKIFGENKLYNVHEHVRIWRKLKDDRAFFEGKKIVEKTKGHRCHLIRIEGQEHFYKVGKQFWNEVSVDNSS